MMVDVKKAKEEALKELIQEKSDEIKTKIKQKLKEIDKAREVVARLEGELNEIISNP